MTSSVQLEVWPTRGTADAPIQLEADDRSPDPSLLDPIRIPKLVAVAEPQSERNTLRARGAQLANVVANVAGAIVILSFARANIIFYQRTHELIGGVFVLQQMLMVVVLLVRRSPRSVSRRPQDWAAALGGSFGVFLLRPGGLQAGATIGIALQLVGLFAWAVSFLALGRSFGLVAANRGLVTGGPYRLVRHPLYASYIIAELGYLVQSFSLWNLAILTFAWSCQIARIASEERMLEEVASYREYQAQVPRRLCPAVW